MTKLYQADSKLILPPFSLEVQTSRALSIQWTPSNGRPIREVTTTRLVRQVSEEWMRYLAGQLEGDGSMIMDETQSKTAHQDVNINTSIESTLAKLQTPDRPVYLKETLRRQQQSGQPRERE